MRPRGNDAQEDQHQDYQQYCSQAHLQPLRRMLERQTISKRHVESVRYRTRKFPRPCEPASRMYADAQTSVLPPSTLQTRAEDALPWPLSAASGDSVMNKQLVVGGIVGALAVTAVGAVAGYRMLDTGCWMLDAGFLSISSSNDSQSIVISHS